MELHEKLTKEQKQRNAILGVTGRRWKKRRAGVLVTGRK
jgi:hypothetical protein